jgi:hypothetical protein
MLPSRLAYALVLLFLVLFPSMVRAESQCSIVYGKNWAFLFSPPKQWEAACPVNDQSGVVVALWPKGTPWAKAPGVMYVTVSEKGSFSLEQFAEDELANFRAQSPKLKIQVVEPIPLLNKSQALVRKLSGDQYGNHELIAYADAGTVYLILVFTSRTQKEYAHLGSAFSEFVASVSPMKIEFRDVEKTPHPALQGTLHDEAAPRP